MARNNILYDRNHVGYDKSIGAKKLYVDGGFPVSLDGMAYEGRLQIHNNVGACSIAEYSGNLPDGGNVYVDNETSEIVVAWPSKQTDSGLLLNPGFETGDTSGWTYETKGGSGTLITSSDYKDAGMYSAYWAGGKGLGSEGGIECLAFNDAKGPVVPGQSVTAKLRVMYNPGGGTPKGSRGQARLAWYRSNDSLISMSEGFLIKTRKYNGKWTDTVVSDRAVPEAAYVKLVAWVTATGKGHTYFDNASWDLPRNVGTPGEEVCLSGTIRDSVGRTANWGGCIQHINPLLYHLHFDGEDGSTNIIDETGVTWQRRVIDSGTPTPVTIRTDKKVFGTGSLYLGTQGGPSGHLENPSIQFNPSGRDFTIQAFVYITNINPNSPFYNRPYIIFSNSWDLLLGFINDDGALYGKVRTTSGYSIIRAAQKGQFFSWHFVEMCRIGGTLYLFYDGHLQGTAPISGDVYLPLAPSGQPELAGKLTMIGDKTTGPGLNSYLWGNIDEFRVLDGLGLHNSDYTVPTNPF